MRAPRTGSARIATTSGAGAESRTARCGSAKQPPRARATASARARVPCVVGLTVLQPKFLEQFPDARFHFKSGRLDQQGTFKGVWLNKEHTEWALEKEQQ